MELVTLRQWAVCVALILVACRDVPGSRVLGLDGITQRNAIVTQFFEPTLLTPDGRLGVKLTDADVAIFQAFGDPEAAVDDGWPVIRPQMAHGAQVQAKLSMGEEAEQLGYAENSPGTVSGQGALVHDPRWSPDGKPFTVADIDDCVEAAPGVSEDPVGVFDCYRLLHLQPRGLSRVNAEGDDERMDALFQAPVTVVVRAWAPSAGKRVRLARPDVVYARYTDDFFASRGPENELLDALEASATADCRLMVAEGTLWAFNETPWIPTAWSKQRPIEAMFEDVKLQTICRHIDPLTHEPACSPAQREEFARVYSLAARPLFLADGEPIISGYENALTGCGYLWITPEGTDVFCRPNPRHAVDLELEAGYESSTGMHFFVVGQHTGWIFQRIDGGINTRRFNPQKLVELTFSPDGEIAGEQCERIEESHDEDDWTNTFLCSKSPEGIRWSSTGTIPFMQCKQVFEECEPPAESWSDNYLCTPDGSRLTLEWSQHHKLAGAEACIPFGDPEADPHCWDDNFLCYFDHAERPFSPVFLNTSAGFWAEQRVPGDRSLPFQRQSPVFQFMTVNNALYPWPQRYAEAGLLRAAPPLKDSLQYWEASFACAVDPDCLLHLPMNELRYDREAEDASKQRRARDVTPDVSANTDFPEKTETPPPSIHPHRGTLSSGAVFAGDVFGNFADERYQAGFYGTAIAFSATGELVIPATSVDEPTCRRNKGCLVGETYDRGFTAQLAFLPTTSLDSLRFPLARHAGLWSVEIDRGTVVAEVNPGGGAPPVRLRSTGSFGHALLSAPLSVQAEHWVHVALRVSEDELERRWVVTLFVNGLPNAVGRMPAISSFAGKSDASPMVRVGPAAACDDCGDGWMVLLDEVMFHRRPLEDQQIAAFAFASGRRTDFLDPVAARRMLAAHFAKHNPRGLALDTDGFPKGVDAADLRIPASFAPHADKFSELVQLGELLFSSPALSTNAAGETQFQAGTGRPMSCAVCHEPQRAFTDGLATAVGVVPLALNTPTLVNRAFGTNQFFDRSAGDIVAQALRPIINHREMSADLDAVIRKVVADPDLGGRLVSIFGHRNKTGDHLALALAAFQIVQLSVDSLADHLMRTGCSVRSPGGTHLDPARVRRGRHVFFHQARCAACHIEPNFTDELTRDTGVAPGPRAFKTATLWDIEATAPYFHDGSRATLRDVLEFYRRGGEGSAHTGSGLRLTDPEIRPLALSDDDLEALEHYVIALQNAGPVLAAGQPSCPQWPDGTLCAAGSTCGNCFNPATTWAGEYRCGTMPASLKTWSDGTWCAVGSSCDYCAQPASYWFGKGFTACGDEPRWTDGTRCGLGSTCGACQNAATYWYGLTATACGDEPGWVDGTLCAAGSSCNMCINPATTWAGQHRCGSMPGSLKTWSDGTLCALGTTCDYCATPASYWYAKAFTACGNEPKWADGTRCGLGSTCHACQNPPTYWPTLGSTACGTEVLGSGVCCAAGSSCNSCAAGWRWVAPAVCGTLAQCK